MIGMLAVSLLGLTYNCTVRPPQALDVSRGTPSVRELTITNASSNWMFSVEVHQQGDDQTADINWPDSPIQVSGKYPYLDTGKGVKSFVAINGGPCAMTETSCMSLISIADSTNGKATILIEPTALWTDKKQDTHEPFVSFIAGDCSRTETSK